MKIPYIRHLSCLLIIISLYAQSIASEIESPYVYERMDDELSDNNLISTATETLNEPTYATTPEAEVEQTITTNSEEIPNLVDSEEDIELPTSGPEREISSFDEPAITEKPLEGPTKACPAKKYKAQDSTKKDYSLPLSEKEAEEILTELYTNKNGFVIPKAETDAIVASGSASTYGEIKLESLKKLLHIINDEKALDGTDIFYSIGSGVGKEVLYVALTTPVKQAIGVEISKTRHDTAQAAKDTLRDDYNINLRRKAVFTNKNILNMHNLNRASVIFMSNLCFPDKFTDELMDKFRRSLKEGTLIITIGKRLPKDPHFVLVKTTELAMSWSNATPIFIYQVQKKELAAKRNFISKYRVC